LLRSLLSGKPAKYIAEISYALYVIHPITAYGAMGDGSPLVKYLIKRPVSLLLSFILAHISTFYFEKKVVRAARTICPDKKIRVEAQEDVAIPA
jgi:peptidoglycan/LPS O-acetylase OafA/YrhL